MDEIIEKIFNLAKKKMKEQGGYDRAAYREYIYETIDYYRQKGQLTDEDSDKFICAQLMKRWNEVEDELARIKR